MATAGCSDGSTAHTSGTDEFPGYSAAPLDSGAAATGSSTAPATAAAPGPNQTAVYIDAVGKTSGPVGAADTGQQPTAVFGPQPLTYANGVIGHDNAGVVNADSAGYLEYDTGSDVTRAGASVAWVPGSTGAVVIVIPSDRWAQNLLPIAGIHLVIFGNGQWHSSVWDMGEQVYASDADHGGRFADVRDGKPHTIDVTIDKASGSAMVTLPDGSTQTVTSPAIGTDTSHYAVWELFESNQPTTSVPATIARLWAS